jgi:raffinose/stachyose/melibiose transport system permease protein
MATTSLTTAGPRLRPVRARRRSFSWNSAWVYLVALFVVAISVGPVLYVWINGFRTTADINTAPAGWPNPWSVDNYVTVLTSQRFWG